MTRRTERAQLASSVLGLLICIGLGIMVVAAAKTVIGP